MGFAKAMCNNGAGAHKHGKGKGWGSREGFDVRPIAGFNNVELLGYFFEEYGDKYVQVTGIKIGSLTQTKGIHTFDLSFDSLPVGEWIDIPDDRSETTTYMWFKNDLYSYDHRQKECLKNILLAIEPDLSNFIVCIGRIKEEDIL